MLVAYVDREYASRLDVVSPGPLDGKRWVHACR
jgi:hypothetical protein